MSERPYDRAFKFLAEEDAEALLLLLGDIQPGENARIELLLMLGGLRYNREELLDLIGRESMIPVEQLKESSFYQYILEEGRQEGRQEGEVTLLRRKLEYRFGTLPSWASQKIERADPTALEQWATRLLDAASLEAVLVDVEPD